MNARAAHRRLIGMLVILACITNTTFLPDGTAQVCTICCSAGVCTTTCT